MPIRVSPWDILLVAVVASQATTLAYLAKPTRKAFALSLPIPFTVAVLAVGRPPDITSILGLVLLLGFTHAVRILHRRVHVPIVLAIALSAVGYCVLAALLLPHLPDDEIAFWMASFGVFALAVVLSRALPRRAEPDHRTPLPVWVKLPIIVSVVSILIALKTLLQGFMTVFPMVGVVAAYEARHSLWTIGRQIPLLMVGMIPMMIASRLTQPLVGLGLSLLIAWAVFLAAFLAATRWSERRTPAAPSSPPQRFP